jgi:hypothetical protein
MDRIALNGCARRADLDAEGAPVVFTEIDLLASSLDPTDPATVNAVRHQANILYQRFLARDATPSELDIHELLLQDDGSGPISGRDFAVLSCFAVSTSTEFVFF